MRAPHYAAQNDTMLLNRPILRIYISSPSPQVPTTWSHSPIFLSLTSFAKLSCWVHTSTVLGSDLSAAPQAEIIRPVPRYLVAVTPYLYLSNPSISTFHCKHPTGCRESTSYISFFRTLGFHSCYPRSQSPKTRDLGIVCSHHRYQWPLNSITQRGHLQLNCSFSEGPLPTDI